MDGEAWAAWKDVVVAHGVLSSSARIWDVTSSFFTDQIKERSIAANSIDRYPVALHPVQDAIISTDHTGLCFGNANGGDLNLFPGLLLVKAKSNADYALVDLRQVEIKVTEANFIETETIPGDATVVGQTWTKANKDGSPDRRFKDNQQIPIVRYGGILFSSSTGISERYMLSNYNAVQKFGAAIHAFQRELKRQAANSTGVFKADDDAVQADPTQKLPPLPDVRGAHEVIVIPVAAVAAFSLLRNTPQSDASPPRPPAAYQSTEINAGRSSAPPPPAISVTQPIEPSQPLPLSPERMVTVSNANVRTAPDRTAQSLRIVKAGTVVVVTERSGSWAMVGDGQSPPWGWMHTSLLKKQP